LRKVEECEEDNFLPVVAMPGVPHALTAKDYSSVPFYEGRETEYETKGPLKKFNFRNLETYGHDGRFRFSLLLFRCIGEFTTKAATKIRNFQEREPFPT
jgi:hypothetical protein